MLQQDIVYYVCVEWVFFELGGNVQEIVQILDSIYYNGNEISVKLECFSNGQIYEFVQVDGCDEGYFRIGGDFVMEFNYFYKFSCNQLMFIGGMDFCLIVECLGQDDVMVISVIVEEIELVNLLLMGVYQLGDFDCDI